MSEGWYTEVAAGAGLTQGDIVIRCPVTIWRATENAASPQRDTFEIDTIIMSQACDLEQNKVENVILCPCELLSVFRRDWEESERMREQNPTDKAFKRLCKNISDGFCWNYTLLNHSGCAESPNDDHRIVDFHEVYTIPKSFLEQLLTQRGGNRLRLRSPYREYLSQSFARFFMRVGLPVAVSDLA